MGTVFWFLAGVVVGAFFSHYVKPVIVKAWNWIVEKFKTTPTTPTT